MGFFRRRKPLGLSRGPSQQSTSGNSATKPVAVDPRRRPPKPKKMQEPRRRQQRDRRPAPILVNPVLALVPFLLVYLGWTSYTMCQTPEWKARVWGALERELGWNVKTTKADVVATDTNHRDGYDDGGDDSFGAWIPSDEETPTTDHREDDDTAGLGRTAGEPNHLRVRIPCGLLVVQNDERTEDVLPLATLAVAEKSVGTAGSTLHARALDRYPQLEKLVVVAGASPGGARGIPEGALRLRMGSAESTIEDSPPLLIVEHDDDDLTAHSGGSDAGETIDLVLGKDFWDNHLATFETDEIRLVRKAKSGNEDAPESRVVVPYILMRSRPSFGTDL